MPIPRTMEELLADMLVRTKRLERRLGGGGGASTPYDAEAGMVMAFSGPVPPEGWLFCDGSLLSRTAYPELFKAIGTTYGNGDGSTTFPLPNYNGRVLVGRDAAQPEFDVLGEVGGAKTVTLTINEMPSHSHQWNAAGTNNPGGTPANWDDIVGANANALGVGPPNIEAAENAIKPRGGGQPHNNLQPYAVANYIISTGKGVGGGSAARDTGGSTPYDALPGIVSPFAGGTVPSGWLLCDGQAISRSIYSRLFATIGTAYGVGDGSSTFNVPDLRGRVPVGGSLGDSSFGTLGQTGGEKAHTLTVGEMPSHDHALAGHTYSWGASGTVSFPGSPNATATPSTGNALFTFQGADGYADTHSRGDGAAHNNLQPYAVTNYIISTGPTIGGGGAVVGPDRTAVSAKAHGSSQSPVNSGWTILSFTSEVFDTANMWSSSDPTKIVIPADGIYILNGGAGISGNPAGRQAVQFKVNGVTVPSGSILDRAVDGTGDPSINASTTASLKKGDYVQLEFYHDTGASKTFGTASWAMPHLSVSLVGGLPGQLTTPDLTRGTTAQRDLVYGVPSTAAQQAALANQVPEWFNTEKGYSEVYYAVTGTSGLTVTGLMVGNTAGWYPVTGTKLFARRGKTNGYQAIPTNGNADPVLAAMDVNRGGFSDNASSGIAVPVGGYYRVTGSIYYTGGTSPSPSIVWAQIFKAGVLAFSQLNQRAAIGTDQMIMATGIAAATAGQVFALVAYTNGVTVSVYGPNAYQTFIEVEYLGPPLVNG